MKTLHRRAFVKQSVGVAGALALAPVNVMSDPKPNGKVRLAFLGLGGRGINLAKFFARRSDVDIVWFCDPDRRRWARAEAALDPTAVKGLKFAQDFRRVLEDPEVDALVIATPDHWHGLATILACQAGKDVYVEKPLAHNLREGRRMIQAARKYGRVVQVGTQSRSAAYVRAAREIVASGQLGEVPLVRVYNLMQHPRAPLGPVGPVPEEFDYDLWCGPAVKLPYHPSRRWLNYAEFSCGPIAGDAIHQLDLARYLMNDPVGPRAVSHMGGLEVLRDGRDTADTQLATYDFGGFKLIFQGALWMPYMKKTPFGLREEDQFPNWPFSSTKIELLGTKGTMYLGRHGGGWQVFDGDQQPIGQAHGRQADQAHIANFIDCIRSRQRPNSDVAQGHASTMLCQLANAAWQAGNQTLVFDPDSETFPEQPAADIYLGRSYRSPWVLPREV